MIKSIKETQNEEDLISHNTKALQLHSLVTEQCVPRSISSGRVNSIGSKENKKTNKQCNHILMNFRSDLE